jgi:hypothetical protein
VLISVVSADVPRSRSRLVLRPAPSASVVVLCSWLSFLGLPALCYSVPCSVYSVIRRANLNMGCCSGICYSCISIFLLL